MLTVFLTTRFSIAWRALSARPDACRVRSCMRRGRWRRRVRRLFRGGRVLDIGGGHGLLAQVMLLLDDSSPDALVIDKRCPLRAPSFTTCSLRRGRDSRDASRSSPALSTTSRSSTATSSCRAMRVARSPIGFSPAPPPRVRGSLCCRAATISMSGDDGGLSGWVDGAVAIDIVRAMRLAETGLSHLDAGDSRGHHAEEPAADWRSTSWLAVAGSR